VKLKLQCCKNIFIVMKSVKMKLTCWKNYVSSGIKGFLLISMLERSSYWLIWSLLAKSCLDRWMIVLFFFSLFLYSYLIITLYILCCYEINYIYIYIYIYIQFRLFFCLIFLTMSRYSEYLLGIHNPGSLYSK